MNLAVLFKRQRNGRNGVFYSQQASHIPGQNCAVWKIASDVSDQDFGSCGRKEMKEAPHEKIKWTCLISYVVDSMRGGLFMFSRTWLRTGQATLDFMFRWDYSHVHFGNAIKTQIQWTMSRLLYKCRSKILKASLLPPIRKRPIIQKNQ